MINWWEGLDFTLKVLYCVAIPATLIMIIQTILSLFGGFEAGAGVDFSDTSGFDGGAHVGELSDAADGGIMSDGGNPADFSVFSMFTLQGIVTFLTVFGWTAIVSISSGTPPLLSMIIGIAFGVLAMFLVGKLIHASRRLTENGTIDLKNAVGENGRVYIPIPANGTQEGKITLYLQGRYFDTAAIQFGDELLATGTAVVVTDVRNDVLVVEKDR